MREVHPALPNLSLYLVGHGANAPALDVDDVVNALNEASTVYHAQHVRFAGRRACEHPEIERLIDAAVAAGFTWQPCLDDSDVGDFVALLSEPRRMALLLPYVTLDSADESIHDSARGSGSYRSTLQALATMAALDLPTEVRVELHRMNQATLEETCMLALKLGVERIVLSLAMPSSTALDALLALPDDALDALYARARRVEEVLAIDVVVDPSLRAEPPFRRCEALDGRWIHFGPTGALAPCDKHVGAGGSPPSGCTLGGGVAIAHGALLELGARYYDSRLTQLHGAAQSVESPCTHCLRVFGCAHWPGGDTPPGSTAGAVPTWRQDWADTGVSG